MSVSCAETLDVDQLRSFLVAVYPAYMYTYIDIDIYLHRERERDVYMLILSCLSGAETLDVDQLRSFLVAVYPEATKTQLTQVLLAVRPLFHDGFTIRSVCFCRSAILFVNAHLSRELVHLKKKKREHLYIYIYIYILYISYIVPLTPPQQWCMCVCV